MAPPPPLWISLHQNCLRQKVKGHTCHLRDRYLRDSMCAVSRVVPALVWCWATVTDAGPTLSQPWILSCSRRTCPLCIKHTYFIFIIILLIEPMVFQCWASVVDDGSTLKQHWFIRLLYQWLFDVGPASQMMAQHWTNRGSFLVSANTIQSANVGLLLGHSLGRWPNINGTLTGCIVFGWSF